jgi:trimeric autotransporter adhesin
MPGVKMLKRAALLSVLMLFGVLLGASPALAASDLTPSTSQLEFGEVDVHFGGTPTQGVSFSDAEPLGSTLIESASVTGQDAANFQIVSDGCSGVQLENGKACSIEVRFDARGVPGSRSATLELATSEGAVEVPLSASAITGTLSASPSSLSFAGIPFTAPGSHNEGENTETESFNIENSANASTRIEATSITGPDASSFSVQWNCEGVTLGTSNSCGMGVRFQPTSPGPKSASLVIANDSGTPLVVPLEGVGLNGPQLSIDGIQALLGSVPLGSSARHTFNLANTGDYPLFIERDFIVTGTPLMFPSLADSCSGQILYPGESCAITIAFRPTTLGEKSAALLFITNTPAITVAGLDGTGVAANESTTRSLEPTDMPAETAPGVVSPPTSAPSLNLAAPPTTPATISSAGPPRLLSLLGHSTLDPGANVQCPPSQTDGCEALSLLVPVARPHSSATRFGHVPALLGSALVQLRAGQGMHVHIPLSRRAAARLKLLGQMRVRLLVVVQSGGAILAQHTSTLTLTARGAVSSAAG